LTDCQKALAPAGRRVDQQVADFPAGGTRADAKKAAIGPDAQQEACLVRDGGTKERSKLGGFGKARLVQAYLRFGKQRRSGKPVEKQPCGDQPLCEGERFYVSPTPSRESSRPGPCWIVTLSP
jgi:hypothetical protein